MHTAFMLDVTAELIHVANTAAKAFREDYEMKTRFYDAKHSLLSSILVLPLHGIDLSWDTPANDEQFLAISIANRRTVHCPFRKLSLGAQHAVIERIGHAPY